MSWLTEHGRVGDHEWMTMMMLVAELLDVYLYNEALVGLVDHNDLPQHLV